MATKPAEPPLLLRGQLKTYQITLTQPTLTRTRPAC